MKKMTIKKLTKERRKHRNKAKSEETKKQKK